MAGDQKAKKSSFGLSSRAQYVAVGVLAAVLGGLLLYRTVFSGQSDAAAGAAPATDTAAIEQLAAPPAPFVMPAEPVMPARASIAPRDPFVLPGPLKKMLEEMNKPRAEDVNKTSESPNGDPEIIKQARGLVLKGILGDAQGRVAFINETTVRAGDELEGFAVLEVREKSVLLKKEQTEVIVELPGTSGKTPAKAAPVQPETPPGDAAQPAPRDAAAPAPRPEKAAPAADPPAENLTNLPPIEQSTESKAKEEEPEQ